MQSEIDELGQEVFQFLREQSSKRGLPLHACINRQLLGLASVAAAQQSPSETSMLGKQLQQILSQEHHSSR